jgi:hypothetical protein
MSWPFKNTPAEAFYPERRDEIERFWESLLAYGLNHLERYQIVSGGLHADSLYALHQHHPQMVTDFLNTRAFGTHTISMDSLDAVAALIKDEAPQDFTRHLLDVMAAVVHKGLLYLKPDLEEAGLTCILQRLSFTPSIDPIPYALPLLKFFSSDCEFDSRYSLLCLTTTVSSKQLKLPEKDQQINMHLLLDEPVIQEHTVYYDRGFLSANWPGWRHRDFEDDAIIKKVKVDRREAYASPEAWREAYAEALGRFLKDKVNQDDRLRYVDNVDKLLLILVYNPGIYDRITGQDVEQIMARLNPIVEMILELQYEDPALRATLKRQVFVNLFSTFPKDLKALNVTPQDLMGLDAQSLAKLEWSWGLNLAYGPLGYCYSYNTTISEVFMHRIEELHGEIPMADMLSSAFVESDAFPYVFNSDKHQASIAPAVLSGKMTKGGKDQIWPTVFDYPNKFNREVCLELFLNRMRLCMFQSDLLPELIKNMQGFFLRRPDLRMEAIERMFRRYPEIFLVIDHRKIGPLLKMMLFTERDLRTLGDKAPDAVRANMLSVDLGL